MKKLPIVKTLFVGILLIITSQTFCQTFLNTPNIESRLYLGKGTNQPLVVGLGGSEGGNAWASDHWKKTRDQFIEKGYAFLALGYFGCKGTPDTLNKIALEDVHNAILEAVKNKQVNKHKIAIVGGSRGGDLALLLASHYPDIKCVVAIVPSHVSFPGHTQHFSTSCWTYQNKELPFVPLTEEAVPALLKGDLRKTFETMLKDNIAEEKALITVENCKGPILLMSATEDEICPSAPMSEKMAARLKSKKFKFAYQHIAIKGKHAEPLQHFDLVFAFLAKHFAKVSG